MPIQRIDARKLARMRREMPPHWAPIIDAMESGAAVLMLRPGAGSFDVNPDEPLITVIGDDPRDADSQGPRGFHVPSLLAHFSHALACVVLAGEAKVEHYATAASVALAQGSNVVLVETQPPHQDAWTRLALESGVMRVLIVTPYVVPGSDLGLWRPSGGTIH
jgi:hypothetical protein